MNIPVTKVIRSELGIEGLSIFGWLAIC